MITQSGHLSPFKYIALGIGIAVAFGYGWHLISRWRSETPILPPPTAYQPNPVDDARLTSFVHHVLIFVLYHETGHLVFRQFNVPIGSMDTGESAADSFAMAMINFKGNGDAGSQEALYDTALFFMGLHQQGADERALKHSDLPAGLEPFDEHQPPLYRFQKLACLLSGTDPERYSNLLQTLGLNADYCARDAQMVLNDMGGRNIRGNLNPDFMAAGNPDTPNIGYKYWEPVSREDNINRLIEHKPLLSPDIIASVRHGYALAQRATVLEEVGQTLLSLRTPTTSITSDAPAGSRTIDIRSKLWESRFQSGLQDFLKGVHPPTTAHVEEISTTSFLSRYNYILYGDNCLFGASNQPIADAYWDINSRTITLCYQLVSEVENVGKSILAREQAQRH